ncbi:carbohydrate porin [Providencia rettgeri]|nr:carbohydrate porin [Providencia rettgeri]
MCDCSGFCHPIPFGGDAQTDLSRIEARLEALEKRAELAERRRSC